jgi:hypothetical protein
MSTPFTTYRDYVFAAYNEGAQTTNREDAAIQAVADFTKAAICREVDSDLPLAKSYLDSYRAAKLRLAGYEITSDFATVIAAVQTRITVDASRAAISDFVNAQVQQGIDDFNGTATLWEAALTESCIDLQRYVDYYRSRHTTYYNPSYFEDHGDASVAQMPDGARPYRFVYQTYYPDLAESVAYVAGDYVLSIVVTGGTLASGEIGSGLTSTDPDAVETLGSLEFTYQDAPQCFSRVMEPSPWKTRETLSCDTCGLSDSDVEDYTADQFLSLRASGYVYALEPRGRSFWVWPKVRNYWQVQVEWDGIKTSFADGDDEMFGPAEARASAFYIKSTLTRAITDSAQNAALLMQLYHLERKKLWAQADEKRRELL